MESIPNFRDNTIFSAAFQDDFAFYFHNSAKSWGIFAPNSHRPPKNGLSPTDS